MYLGHNDLLTKHQRYRVYKSAYRYLISNVGNKVYSICFCIQKCKYINNNNLHDKLIRGFIENWIQTNLPEIYEQKPKNTTSAYWFPLDDFWSRVIILQRAIEKTKPEIYKKFERIINKLWKRR